jgi:hypothetical protein
MLRFFFGRVYVVGCPSIIIWFLYTQRHSTYMAFRVLHIRNRTMTARETASNVPGLRRISAQTVRNRLRENGLRAGRPYLSAILRRRHRYYTVSRRLQILCIMFKFYITKTILYCVTKITNIMYNVQVLYT